MKRFITIACLMCILTIAPAGISATPKEYLEIVDLMNKELNLPQEFEGGLTMTKFDINDEMEIEMSFSITSISDDTDTDNIIFIKAFRDSFLESLGKGSDMKIIAEQLGMPLRIKVYSTGGKLKINEKFLPSEL